MLKIKQALFLMFGATSFIIFYIGFLNFVTTNDQFIGKIMLVFSAIVSIGVLIGTLYISNNITKPIESLVKKMNEFSHNNKINNTYNSQGIHELHYLHENFENMAESVGKTIEKEKTLNHELKEVDKRKVEFISMISHELKTPIMPILGYIKLLKKQEMLGKLNQQQIEALDEIHLATIRLQKLIQDVLTSQKIDLEELAVTKTRVKISSILDSVIRAYSPICENKSVILEKNRIDDQDIVTDPDRVNQVFSNLISNALDFMPKHGGQIIIGANTAKKNIIFFVRDNGSGISSTEQKNIFKKFYQVDTSSTRKKEGSGLGLAICKGIIKKLGGNIWVNSKIGEGTNFYFSLPNEIITIPN